MHLKSTLYIYFICKESQLFLRIFFSFILEALPRSEIDINLGINQFSYSERLIHSKRHLKSCLCVEFKENLLSLFSWKESLPKPGIGISNFNFHQCFCCKQLFYPKRHLKESYYMLFEENHSSKFSEIHTSKI